MIIDDEPIVLEGMRMFPWKNENCTLVGEARDGADGLALAKKLMPDIVFTDIKMPGMNGLEFADAFREIHSNALIIVFTGYSEFSYAQNEVEGAEITRSLRSSNYERIRALCALRAGLYL